MAFRAGREQYRQIYLVPRDMTDKIIGRKIRYGYINFPVRAAHNGVFVFFTAAESAQDYGKRYQ
jgi:hypothetical protein